MKKLTWIPILFLAFTAFAVGPFPVYQSTPPYLPGAAAASDSDQFPLCQGSCNQASNLTKSSLHNLNGWLHADFHDSTFVFLDSSTGFTAVQYDTVKAVKHGYQVCFRMTAGLTGTSNATTFTLGAFPVAIRPPATVTVALGGALTDSTVAGRLGDVQIASTGVATLRRSNYAQAVVSATFLASGTKAIAAGSGGCYDTQP